jgi:FtsH-binding integral membrane protein
MKISTFITILLFVGVVFFVMAMMTQEANDKFDTEINTTSWEGRYDYASEVNSSVNPLIQSIDDITNEEKGWLEKVGSGFTGIISAVTLLPALVWQSFSMGGSLLTGGFTSLGIPAYILTVFIIALTVWGIFKLIGFFQRWDA